MEIERLKGLAAMSRKLNIVRLPIKLLIIFGLAYCADGFASSVNIGQVIQSGGNNSLTIGANSSDFVSGSGNKKELTQSLRKFDSIQTYVSAELNISQSKDFSIKITGDDNILPLIKFNIEDETLKLYTEKSFSTKNPLVIDLSLGGLRSLLANGSGNISLKDVEGDHLQIELNGSGDIFGSGVISQLNVVLQGSGDMDFTQLKSKNCEVSLIGSGDIAIFAEQSVNAKIQGSGDISVSGHPGTVKQSIDGAGQITVK